MDISGEEEVVGVVVEREELLVSTEAVVAMELLADSTAVDKSDSSVGREVVVVAVEEILVPSEAVVTMELPNGTFEDSTTVDLSTSSVGRLVVIEGGLVLRESSDSES